MCLPTEHLGVHKNSLNCVRAFQIELEFGSVGFEGGGKPEYPEKNLSEHGREPTTNLNHAWRRRQDSNPDRIGGRRVLSPLRDPCSPKNLSVFFSSPFRWSLVVRLYNNKANFILTS